MFAVAKGNLTPDLCNEIGSAAVHLSFSLMNSFSLKSVICAQTVSIRSSPQCWFSEIMEIFLLVRKKKILKLP